MSQKLRADGVIRSLEKLERRAHERFPVSGMRAAIGEVLDVARQTERRAQTGSSLGFVARVGRLVAFGVLIVLLAAVVVPLFSPIPLSWLNSVLPGGFDQSFSFFDFLEVLASMLLLIAGPILYFRDSRTRAKRKHVFKYLHELRQYAHVIDMHQLTKDPVALSPGSKRTASSPERSMTPYELARYLNYCSEVLSLIGKLAALYSEFTDDPEITAAVNDVETLTAGMARKIWQKIMVLDNEIAMADGFGGRTKKAPADDDGAFLKKRG